MIGMCFVSFLVLLVISIIVSLILHFSGYSVRGGWDSFVNKVIIGWLGAWLGSPVFGYWFDALKYEGDIDIYIIPAILGAFALIIFAVDFVRTCSAACGGSEDTSL